MTNIWTLSNGSRSAVKVDSNGIAAVETEPRPAHKRYAVCDPSRIGDLLSDAGFEVEAAYGSNRKRFLKSPRTAILSVRSRGLALPTGSSRDEYQPQCNIYFDHRGRSALKFTAGALRVECSNAFTRPLFKLHHCSDDAQRFAENPLEFVNRALSMAYAPIRRVEASRDCDGAEGLLNSVLEKAPRLASKAFEAWRGTYVPEVGRKSLWGALQALTAPSVRRLDEFAGRLLNSDDILSDDPAIRAVHVATCWN